MTRLAVGLSFVLAALCTGIATQASFDAEKQSLPPHVEPPDAEVTEDVPVFRPEDIDRTVVYLGAVEHQRLEQERREREAIAVAVAIEADRARQTVPRVSRPSTGVSGDCARIAAEFGLPVSVIIAESRCQPDAYNPTGCGGRGCLGAAQLDAGHFAAVSPWNPAVAGTCYGLSYEECARRLPSSAW